MAKPARPEGFADAREEKRSSSDATALLRTAAVVRNRRHVRNRVDADAERGQCTHRRLAAGARALDPHVQVLDALLLGGAACRFGSHLGGERRALARALEALATAGSPGQRPALTVGDGDDGV